MNKTASVVLGILLLTGCSLDNKQHASAECDARAIEHRLSGVDLARHKNLCMLGMGYKRNTLCDNKTIENSSSALCYSAKWQFWIDEQKLL